MPVRPSGKPSLVRGSHCEKALHEENKFQRRGAFPAIPVEALASRIRHNKCFISARVGDDERTGSRSTKFDCFRGLETVALRHPDVQKNHIRQPVFDCFQGVAASTNHTGFHTIQREIRRSSNSSAAIIVDDQNACCTASAHAALVTWVSSRHIGLPLAQAINPIRSKHDTARRGTLAYCRLSNVSDCVSQVSTTAATQAASLTELLRQACPQIEARTVPRLRRISRRRLRGESVIAMRTQTNPAGRCDEKMILNKMLRVGPIQLVSG
jgi:hypothetical protein